jgi:Piwi domain
MSYTPYHAKPVLNIAPIVVPDSIIRAGVLPYDPKTGDDDLNKLRQMHRGTHAVARKGDLIVCLPRVENTPMVGKGPQEIRLRDNLGLVGVLLREALIDHFHALQRPLTNHRPITFLAQNDLLKEALPPGLAAPLWLGLFPRYEVDVRVFFFSNQEPFLGLALDSRTRRRVTASADELIGAGIKLQGLYVGRRSPNDDPRFEPTFELLGRVSALQDDELQLDDAREGMPSVKAGDCYVELSPHTFSNLLGQIFTDRADEVQEALFQKTAARRVGPAKLQDVRKVIGYLQKQGLEISHAITVSVGALLEGNTLPKLDTAPKPVYVFDPTGAKTDTWADGGLQRCGPYSQQTFSKNHPRIAVVCQASAKGRVEQFLHKFFNGQRHPKKKTGPFDNGLIGKYRLEGVTPKFFLADNPTAPAYQRAAQAAQEAVSGEERWDIALVQIEKEFRNLEGASNPYLVTKHAFLTHQTPVQEFTLETASLWEGQLAYALNNMALATYSKLGGTPWLLRCDRAIAHELVIGIGSAKVGDGRLGDRERVVGFTTVFSGDGDYRITNRSQVVPYEKYGEELLSTLSSTVSSVSQDMNWQDGDHVRLVFHAYKPFRNVEAEAVKSLMSTLGRYDVDFAFVELSQRHPYLLFDEGQEGFYDYEAKTKKGAYAPERGRMLKISKGEVLIVLTGPRDVKRPEDGLPSPILLRLHRESTFTDTTYLARQVYAFANHSWRSFFPGSLPVTVQYSEMIAGLLGKLGRLPNWNADVLWGRIGRSRWFL